MAFTDEQIAAYMSHIEELFWSQRRPPLNLGHEMREGQRVTGNTVELFFVRPL